MKLDACSYNLCRAYSKAAQSYPWYFIWTPILIIISGESSSLVVTLGTTSWHGGILYSRTRTSTRFELVIPSWNVGWSQDTSANEGHSIPWASKITDKEELFRPDPCTLGASWLWSIQSLRGPGSHANTKHMGDMSIRIERVITP